MCIVGMYTQPLLPVFWLAVALTRVLFRGFQDLGSMVCAGQERPRPFPHHRSQSLPPPGLLECGGTPQLLLLESLRNAVTGHSMEYDCEFFGPLFCIERLTTHTTAWAHGCW